MEYEKDKKKDEKKKEEKDTKEDIVMKIIGKDKSLVRKDLEAKLKRIRRQQACLKKFRKLSNICADEFTDFDKSEDYSWWQGVEDPRGVYFALGTKFCSRYKKGDQLFNCYGRRTNRFLLVNYGFVLRYNKYNSLGFKVFVTFDKETSSADAQMHQKVIRMKQNRLSLDLLQYLRANLIFNFGFKEEDRTTAVVSMPVHIDFEIFTL
jgi:hypothetical protein